MENKIRDLTQNNDDNSEGQWIGANFELFDDGYKWLCEYYKFMQFFYC